MSNIDNSNAQWWRWPLVPVASVFGAIIGTVLFVLLQWFSMKMSGGYSEDGWYFRYILPIFKDGIFGFIFVYAGCFVAPRGKIIVGSVLATIVGLFFILALVYNISDPITGTGYKIHSVITGVSLFVGAVLGVIQGQKT